MQFPPDMAYRSTTVEQIFPSRRTRDGLRFVAQRYTPETSNTAGVTLLFFHCAGSHKESWEPTIEHILSAKSRPVNGAALVREAWSFEMQNHGQSAVINDAALETIAVEEYADGVKHFVATGVLDGHKLVGIGHSLGATALLLTSVPDGLPVVPYSAILLVESTIITREAYNAHREEREAVLVNLSKAISKRRHIWNSREEAMRYFQERLPWSTWHPRVLELYVQHGLREIDDPCGSEGKTKVTLCCKKEQERATYLHNEPHFAAVDVVRYLPLSFPIHFILGGVIDLVPDYIHESVTSLRKVAPVQRVPDAGHFVVQQNPEGLAAAIVETITGEAIALNHHTSHL
ncbi:alpha/beta-hydrolase [Trametes punicea]|nr:alpha/beta-hydrolase [Trametes punicea]